MKHVDTSKVVAHDLARHLDERIETFLHDYMDRCAALDVGYEDATRLALNVFTHYAIIASHGMHVSEDEMLAFCQWQYRQMRVPEERVRPSSRRAVA